MARRRRSHGGRSPKPVWVVACEDSDSARDYLKALNTSCGDPVSLKSANKDRNRTAPQQVVQRAVQKFEDMNIPSTGDDADRVWAIIDADPQAGPHRQDQIAEAVELAEEKGVELVVSNPCFEHWVHLHLEDCDGGHGSAAEAVAALQKSWSAHLGGSYQKNNPHFSKLLTEKRVDAAIERAKRQHGNKDNARAHECSACVTELYRLAEAMRDAAGAAQ